MSTHDHDSEPALDEPRHEHGPQPGHGQGHGHGHGPQPGPGQEHGHEHGPQPGQGQGHEHGPQPDHGHGHGHGTETEGQHAGPAAVGHSHPGGLRGFLGGIFAPHSHDAADSIDDALTTSDAGIRAVKLSLVALAVTAA
ncbi:MAG TPA: hypothetical protein VLJ88_05975, partial [Propionibacteriaceae bacterium]|nr:hypothetical protein [Propionibacteriaceae bacterium]